MESLLSRGSKSIIAFVIFNPHLSMTDRFTTTTTTGYGSRIMNSIKGVVVGLILFVSSFGLLYWNEGRVDMSEIASTATEISSETQDTAANGQLISSTGIFNSEETIGDNLFLNPDKFIAVERSVEMYAWEETSESKSTTNTGGSETTETTYKYDKIWTSNPQSSSNFQQVQGHENPAKTLDGDIVKAANATLGVYGVDMAKVELPPFEKLPLTDKNVVLKDGAVLANSDYLFISKTAGSTFTAPAIGDLRIGYTVLYPGENGTIFGKLDGANIAPYFDVDNNELYRIFSGTRDEALSTMHSEYTMMLWIFRAIGFLMMWVGLAMLFGPVSVLLDFLPIFGQISRALIGAVTFLVSLILSAVTILVSMILHNIVALVVSVVVVVGLIIGLVIFLKHRKK